VEGAVVEFWQNRYQSGICDSIFCPIRMDQKLHICGASNSFYGELLSRFPAKVFAGQIVMYIYSV
jgi:hypothetical protein